MRRVIQSSLILLWAEAAGVPQDPIQAHLYADKVLRHQFVSAFNQWALEHPQDAPGKPDEHAHKLNRGDAERFRAARKAWKEFDDAMKRAGY